SLLFNPAEDDVCPGLRPILRVNILKDHEIIKLFCDFQRRQFTKVRRSGVGGVRRSKQCGRAASNGFQQQLRGIQLQSDMLRPTERKVRMVIGMVPDLVSFVNDATNKRRVTLRVYSDDEKRGL